MSSKALLASVAVTVLAVGLGSACTGGGGNPTPVPTAPPATVTLLSLSNTSAVAANAAVFGGVLAQPFTVATVGKLITVQFTSSAPVNLTYSVRDPNNAVVIPNNTTGNTQSSTSSFTPVIAGVYRLTTTATNAITAGTTVNVNITQ